MATITLDELLKTTELTPEQLEETCSDEHIIKVSLFMDSWRIIIPLLNLDATEQEEIEYDARSEKEKRLLALRKWKSKFAFNATYQKLIDTFLTVGRADLAEKVCNLLRHEQGIMRTVVVNVCVCN